jgi:hypothetical protein
MVNTPSLAVTPNGTESLARSIKVRKDIIFKLFLVPGLLIPGLLITVLTGCANNTATTDHSVDHYSLVRSAVYTQRELINIGLNPNPQTSSQRQQLLLRSYCDLIDRRTIYAATQPESCSELETENRSCISKFHRCLKTCQLRSQECRRCEQPAISCGGWEAG